MSTPDIPATLATVAALLGDAVTHPVYQWGAPADVDPTRPWLVLQFIPGGGPAGSPILVNAEWLIGLRVIGAARTPNAHGAPTSAVYDAAMDAADTARAALLDPALWRAAGLVVIDHQAAFGADTDADVVNVTDDYQLRVATGC